MRIVCPVLISCALVACQSTAVEAPASPGAFLGVETGVPPQDLVREMDLGFEVRQQGRLVTIVTMGSAAHEAGIREGDVLVQLDDVILYSQDDMDDFLSVHGPGDQVTVTVVRGESHQQERLRVELGSGAARGKKGIHWQYASLAQLPSALDRARAEKKRVLVGLSGAET